MNIIIWFKDKDSNFLIPSLNILNKLYGNVDIIGIIPPPLEKYSINFNGKLLQVIDSEQLPLYNYDIIVLTGKNISLVPILQEKIDVDIDKVVLDRTICVAGFSMERYKKLRHSKLSIISRLCWGGFIYNSLGLPFLSPTINLYIPEKDFLKLLKNPMFYMNEELKFLKMEYDSALPFSNYPVFMLHDIEIHMNHYGNMTIEEAKSVWEKRASRINWFNLVIAMETEDPKILEEFDKLPYTKKICFVPFKTNLESGFYVNCNIVKSQPLWWHVNYMAKLQLPPCCDFFEVLNYGKKVQLY